MKKDDPLPEWVIDTRERLAAYPGGGEGLVRDLFLALATDGMEAGIMIGDEAIAIPSGIPRGFDRLTKDAKDLLCAVLGEYLEGERETAAARHLPRPDERVRTLDEAFGLKRRRAIAPTHEDRFGRLIAYYVEGSRQIPKGDKRAPFGKLRLPGIPEEGLPTTATKGRPSVYEEVAAHMRREHGLKKIKGDRVRQIWRAWFSDRPPRKRGGPVSLPTLTKEQEAQALGIVESEVKYATIPEWFERDDLRSPAWVAALHAIDSYSLDKGASLETWIWIKVHFAILDQVRKAQTTRSREAPLPDDD